MGSLSQVLDDDYNARMNMSDRLEAAWGQYVDSGYTDDAAFEQCESIRRSLIQLRFGDFATGEERFSRPRHGFSGLLSRPLGPLPENPKVVHPTEEALASLPDFRLHAALLFVVATSTLISLTIFAPWLVISPIGLLTAFFISKLGGVAGTIVTILVTMVLFKVISGSNSAPSYRGRFLDKAAAYEEQWFRMGAESWNLRQKTASCALFGLVHITYLFLPVTSLLVIMLIGAVYMATYLRTYSRSGSTEKAVLASAKLHAAYNRYAIAYLVIALATLFIAEKLF